MNTYFIPKWDHYSSLTEIIPQIPAPPGIHNGAVVMTGKFIITSSCKYDLSRIKQCATDTNKLCGFGYGWLPNSHKNWSIRIGWRVSSAGRLVLSLYSYVNGKRTIKPIGTHTTFKFDTEYNFEIKNDLIKKEAVVTIGNFSTSIPFNKLPEFGYVLKPYFGGDCTSPQDMYINLTYSLS